MKSLKTKSKFKKIPKSAHLFLCNGNNFTGIYLAHL